MSKYEKAYKIATTIVGYTPEEVNEAKSTLQELVDKETPRKVLIKGTVIQCPKCFTIFPYVTGPLGPCVTSTEYCPECGQKLDWSD